MFSPGVGKNVEFCKIMQINYEISNYENKF